MQHSKLIASIDVDPQKTFTPLCPNELPVPEGDLIGAALNAQADLAQLRVLSKDSHPKEAIWRVDSPVEMLQPLDHKNADLTWVSHGVPGTVGFETIADIPAVTEYDYVVWKGIEADLHPYGACYHDIEEKLSTGLIEWLQIRKVEIVLVGGLATDYCVKTTALQLQRSAKFNQVIVNLEASRGLAPETVEAAIHEMKQAGIIIVKQTAEIKALINQS
ncbi:isochorismatase family protein [Vibrio sp. SS-MA-C1-2]|uniref:isochorismatase family protein n=1 Tax=Vibrio sp. SS-MA-C1-2 TaxID=2908646 RepID=UPI001F325953|nr:isochorismatase family protein [Vibrio sp. SS-MA-C1-2]UJF19078.1 isochorismatase family protein [Vibrio sp. SS-MA-C1-2]